MKCLVCGKEIPDRGGPGAKPKYHTGCRAIAYRKRDSARKGPGPSRQHGWEVEAYNSDGAGRRHQEFSGRELKGEGSRFVFAHTSRRSEE